MPNACAGFLKRQDQLGSGVSLNYRGTSAYGTIYGGVCSLIATLFFTFFTTIQLYAWIFKPQYSQTTSIGYLGREEEKTYEIPVQQFLPTFAIITGYDDEMSEWIYNNPKWFTWNVTQYTENGPSEGVLLDTVTCEDLINSWTDISEDERDSFLRELFYIGKMLCPNTTSLFVEGGLDGDTYIDISVYATELAYEEGVVNESMIYQADITRYFNAEQYQEDGYQPAITLFDDMVLFREGYETQ